MNTTIDITEGSTSTGSMKISDIINGIRFLDVKSNITNQYYDLELHNLIGEYDDVLQDNTISDTELNESVQFVFEEICDRLNEIASEDLIFGAHECDGADYGFWSLEE